MSWRDTVVSPANSGTSLHSDQVKADKRGSR